MLTVMSKLHRTGLLTVPGLLGLAQAGMTTGLNLMMLLRVAARLHPRRLAVTDENEQLSYTELWQQTEALAAVLHTEYGASAQQKAAIACRNHAAAIKALFAFSRLGTHVFLVNPEMSADQVRALHERFRFDFHVHDEPPAHLFDSSPRKTTALPAYHPTAPCIDRMALSRPRKVRLKRARSGNIVVLTGGTTGQPKAASRKPSILHFVPPFLALLRQVHLDRYRSVHIATPLYHGFGLAALVLGVVLGAQMYFRKRFDAVGSCELIARHRIEVVALVPLMLQRMLRHDAGSLASLRCIVSGGALLDPALARHALERLGPTLFNLYGTSEAGFCILAPPEILGQKPQSIGKPVWGVKARIVNERDQLVGAGTVGRLCIRSAWSTSRKSWIETGDLAYRDADGDVFLCGRADDMIVSGGENVYPIELENVLVQHPDISSAAVVGIPDAEFGQRLKAVVVGRSGTALEPGALLDWLRPRVARYQMPAVIEVRDELPYTALGKLDRRALRG
jgi:acyl-CoA synthetase (AMP-forming)/AMP-acid ligase II